MKTGNNLIARFMGWETINGTDDRFKVPNLYPIYNMDDDENTGWTETSPEEMQFQDRWDWLMPVIEKIASTELTYKNVDEKYFPYPRTFGMKSDDGQFMFRFNASSLHYGNTLIAAAYDAVIDWLEWNVKEDEVYHND